MPTLGEALSLFVANREILYLKSIATRTHTAFSQIPLGEAIQKDGREQFLVHSLDGITWRFPAPEDFLRFNNIKLSDSGILFMVENFWHMRKDGENQYTTVIPNPRRDIEAVVLPEDRSATTTSKLKIQMKNGTESLKIGVLGTYDQYEPVKVGLAVVCDGQYFALPASVEFSSRTAFSNVLVYDVDIKALAAKVTAIEKTKGVNSPEYHFAIGMLMGAVENSYFL